MNQRARARVPPVRSHVARAHSAPVLGAAAVLVVVLLLLVLVVVLPVGILLLGSTSPIAYQY